MLGFGKRAYDECFSVENVIIIGTGALGDTCQVSCGETGLGTKMATPVRKGGPCFIGNSPGKSRGPFSPVLEKFCMPDEDNSIKAVTEIM